MPDRRKRKRRHRSSARQNRSCTSSQEELRNKITLSHRRLMIRAGCSMPLYLVISTRIQALDHHIMIITTAVDSETPQHIMGSSSGSNLESVSYSNFLVGVQAVYEVSSTHSKRIIPTGWLHCKTLTTRPSKRSRACLGQPRLAPLPPLPPQCTTPAKYLTARISICLTFHKILWLNSDRWDTHRKKVTSAA